MQRSPVAGVHTTTSDVLLPTRCIDGGTCRDFRRTERTHVGQTEGRREAARSDMTPIAAVVAVLVVVVTLLTFAFAGVLQRVKSLEKRFRAGVASPSGEEGSDHYEVAPQGEARVAAVLFVQAGCPVCSDVIPAFVQAAASQSTIDVEFVILSDVSATPSSEVRVVTDPELHQRLNPGYFPAILVVDKASVIVAAEPAGSVDAVKHLVSRTFTYADKLKGRA